jgi:hypothetical protein
MKNNLIYVEMVKTIQYTTPKTPPPTNMVYATTMAFALMACTLYKMVCTRLVVESW